MTTATQLNALYDGIETELDGVRQRVEDQWADAFRLVYGPESEPPAAGGKLLRPALCLLSAGACGADDLKRFEHMATAMELLHLAALAHDDVVDSAALRRGAVSLNRRWDNHTAVLGGDYLVAHALTILTHYDSCEVVASALESIHEMAEGELMTFGRGKDNLGPDDCVRLAKKKTASLFAVACCTPPLLLDKALRAPLHAFGMGLGTAFQIVDDILDLEQDAGTLGKPACSDIVEDKRTLPMLYLQDELNGEDRRRFASLFGAPLADADRKWVSGQLIATGARDRAARVAHQYVEEGCAALQDLPPSPYLDTMRVVADFVVARDS